VRGGVAGVQEFSEMKHQDIFSKFPYPNCIPSAFCNFSELLQLLNSVLYGPYVGRLAAELSAGAA
jgi:hypothetical protein